MTHPKDCACLRHGSLHLDAVLQARGHGFLAQDIVSLLEKCRRDFEVQMVLNRDDHSIGKPLPDGAYRLGGGSK